MKETPTFQHVTHIRVENLEIARYCKLLSRAARSGYAKVVISAGLYLVLKEM